MPNESDDDSPAPPASDPLPVPELVPGYGWVVWPGSQLDESAERLVGLHRPERDDDWYGGQGCQYCGRRWPCEEVRWAADRLGPPGRHRLRSIRRFPVRRFVVALLLLCCVVILVVPLSCAPARAAPAYAPGASAARQGETP